VSAQKTFWVVTAPQGSHGEEPDYLESSIQTGILDGSTMNDYFRSLPDGNHYAAVNKTWDGAYLFKIGASGGVSWSYHWDNPFQIAGLEADGDGNAYVQGDQLYKFSPGGSLSGTADIGGGFFASKSRHVPIVLAVSHAHNRVYSLVNRTNDYSNYDILMFNSALNLLKTVKLPDGIVPLGGVFVDETGDVWVAGTDGNQSLFVFHYNYDLSPYAAMRQAAQIYADGGDAVYMPSAVNPGGGLIIRNGGLFWRVSDSGFGIPGVANADRPLVVDSSGSIYGAGNDGIGIVKISTDNAFTWNPPFINVFPSVLTIPKPGALDVAGISDSSIMISRYRSYASLPQAGSSDGLVTFTSNIANASVSAPSTETKTAAMIDAGAGYYSDLAAVTPFYEVNTGTAPISQPAQITITYSTTTLAALGLTTDNIGVYQYAFGSDWARVADQTTDTSHNRITAKPSGGGQVFAILGEVEMYGVYSADGVADYYSADPDAEVGMPSADAKAAPLAAASSQGLTPATSLYQIRTVSGALNPVAGLSVNYSTTTLAELGIAAEDLNLYAYNAATGWTELDDQYIDTDYDSVFAVVLQNAEYFGVFAQCPVQFNLRYFFA
jgi:hypothetical protein